MWLASCRWVGSSAGLGLWGLLPKRWLRLGRARPRAPAPGRFSVLPKWVAKPGLAAPCRGFPRRAQPAEDHRGNPRAGAVSCTPPDCPRNQPYRWRGHAAQNRNPGFDPSPPNNTKCTPANPNSNPTHGLPQPPPHPVARCPDLIVGVCGRAAPPPTTTQPTPQRWGTSRNPPRGLRLEHPAHTRTNNLTETNHKREASGHTPTKTNHSPPDAKRTHPTPLRGRVCQPPTHQQPTLADPNPSIEQDEATCQHRVPHHPSPARAPETPTGLKGA